MIRYIISIAGLLASLASYSQQKCDSNLIQADKVLLQDFWISFKEALNDKDKTKLENLCRFPFNCDYCILDSANQSDQPYIKVSKTSFEKSQYKIFFTDRLINEVNKHSLPKDIFIFKPYYNTLDKKCSYSFSYIALEENRQHPGRQHFFDVQKVKGKFKIISAWTVP